MEGRDDGEGRTEGALDVPLPTEAHKTTRCTKGASLDAQALTRLGTGHRSAPGGAARMLRAASGLAGQARFHIWASCGRLFW